jgi:putative spermidine/putrescine transport system permease protein
MALFSVFTGDPLQRPNVTFTTRQYGRLLEDSLYVESLWSTLKIGAITTASALTLGYPLAHWLARMRSRAGHALLLMAGSRQCLPASWCAPSRCVARTTKQGAGAPPADL